MSYEEKLQNYNAVKPKNECFQTFIDYIVNVFLQEYFCL